MHFSRYLRALCALLPLAISSQAGASEYGCTVLLCLANPAGPTAVGQCVPPINRLWDDLWHRRGFPTCEEGGGRAGGNYAEPFATWYEPCPGGTTALGVGEIAYVTGGASYVGIGEGGPENSGPKTCVSGGFYNDRMGMIYSTAVQIQPVPSINIYINHKFERRVFQY